MAEIEYDLEKILPQVPERAAPIIAITSHIARELEEMEKNGANFEEGLTERHLDMLAVSTGKFLMQEDNFLDYDTVEENEDQEGNQDEEDEKNVFRESRLENEIWERENSKAREVLRWKYGIDYDEEVNRAREGMQRLVNNLGIPDDAKSIIRGTLDNVNYDTNSTIIEVEYDSETHSYIVRTSPALDLAMATGISKVFGQEINKKMLQSIIASHVGHEGGHVVGSALVDGETLDDKSAAKKYADPYMVDFPITYDSEATKESPGINYAYQTMKEERMAGFFEHELVAGLELNTEASRDINRKQLADVFGVGLHPLDLIATSAKTIDYLIDNGVSKNDPRIYEIFHLMQGMILANTPVAELFPYKQSEAEYILNNAWQNKVSEQTTPTNVE